MDSKQLLRKLQNAPPATIEMPDQQKSLRMGGAKSIYLPSVSDVAKAIQRIPKGQTMTINELRKHICHTFQTDTACPARTIKYWKWLANLDDGLKSIYTQYDIPWWRILKDGKPSRHMPGGIEQHLKILKTEGVDFAR